MRPGEIRIAFRSEPAPWNAKETVPVPELLLAELEFGVAQGTGTDATTIRYLAQMGLKGGEAGHVLAKRYGDSGSYLSGNVVPISAAVNRGTDKQRENAVANYLANGRVCVVIELAYEGAQKGRTRPSHFIYSIWSRCQEDRQRIENPPAAVNVYGPLPPGYPQ